MIILNTQKLGTGWRKFCAIFEGANLLAKRLYAPDLILNENMQNLYN